MTDHEQQEWDLRMRNYDAEIANLNAETAKAIREMRLPPVVLAAVVLGIAGPVGVLILSLWLAVPLAG